MIQIERALHQEIMWRLKALPVLAIPVPNSTHFPTCSPAEREMAARIIAQMKSNGMLLTGAPDICVFLPGGRGGLLELKRPKSRDLFHTRPAGRPSAAQAELAERAAQLGVNHAFCDSWDQVRARLTEWGAT